MPSRSNAPRRTSAASGSSGPRMRGPTSTTVTSLPNRANAWASSSPIGPPPTTASVAGSTDASSASWFVQNGVSARPSIGGTEARVPGFSTTPRLASTRVVPPSDRSTSTTRGPASRPCPRSRRAPDLSRRSAATVSSQSSVASSRMRRATTEKSGSTVAAPASSAARRVSTTAPAARMNILEGMQPQ